MPSIHVAIVDRAAAKHLLAGTKNIETRFYQRRRPPFGRIHPGDIVHFKLSGDIFIGTTGVLRVLEFVDLTPAGVAHLRSRYNHAIQAPALYWLSRRCCRYGLLIWIKPLVPSPSGMRIARQYGNGWLVLPRCPPDNLPTQRHPKS